MNQTETQPKTAAELLPATLARLEQTYGAGLLAEQTPPPSSRIEPPCDKLKDSPKNPLRTDWQRKWLRLDSTRPQVQTAADDVEKWAARFSRCKREKTGHLVIVGDYGVGKTEMAERMQEWVRGIRVSLWPKFWPKIPRVEFIEFGHVAFLETVEFKNWLSDNTEVDKGTDLMFLEDIGAEVDRFKTGEPTERLREIFNAFKNKWLVVTTNVPVKQWESRWDGRVMDRLLRNSVIVDMSGVPSYQVTKYEI